MPASTPASLAETSPFLLEVLAGLSGVRRTLPCKYFYDADGSALFDRICELPEYYQTRTEDAILETCFGEVAAHVGGCRTLVEFGSGSSLKTRRLLEGLEGLRQYVPVDISGDHLHETAERLRAEHPGLTVTPVCADYTTLDADHLAFTQDTLFYFPGSTIGNFDPGDAVEFLRYVRRLCEGRAGRLLIGVDLKKDVRLLEAAYNDAEGVTAAFNRNILCHINRALEADFDPDAFDHYAFYNAERSRIEMHLVSRRRQRVCIGGRMLEFLEGESIHTENSYKYAPEEFAALAGAAGLCVEGFWTDPDRLFSIQLLRPC